MGGVAANAGAFLVNELGASLEAQFVDNDLFDARAVTVIDGVISPARTPRNMFFVWHDPAEKHDLLIFVGEAQPNVGAANVCNEVLDYAAARGVTRAITFAAMASQTHPTEPMRVFAGATSKDLLAEVTGVGLEPLGAGQIGGLNGALLGAAAKRDIEGVCILGEMPFFAANLPNPKSTLSVLRAFADITDIYLDLSEMAGHAEQMEPKLGALFDKITEQAGAEPEDPWSESLHDYPDPHDHPDSPDDEPALDQETRKRIEQLFLQAKHDRSVAPALKQELDRLGVFDQYEDRFLDLFKDAA
jgi:hypothetical protein